MDFMEAEDSFPSAGVMVFHRYGNVMFGRRGAETQRNAVYTTKDTKSTR